MDTYRRRQRLITTVRRHDVIGARGCLGPGHPVRASAVRKLGPGGAVGFLPGEAFLGGEPGLGAPGSRTGAHRVWASVTDLIC